MPKPIHNAGLHWRKTTGLDPASIALYEQRLGAILENWRHTPYMIGQQVRGVGTDCVRFVCAVLDETFHRGPTPIVTLPDDAALHTRAGAVAGMRRIRELYMPNDPIEDGSLEPGDVIVTGPHGGGPGHAMIVGPKSNEIWQASAAEVHVTGLGFSTTRVFRVYRMSDRSVACK